jgi:hypothetical protein
MLLSLLFACAPVTPTLGSEEVCFPMTYNETALYCGDTGRAAFVCFVGDGCWVTDKNGVNVGIDDCGDPAAIIAAKQEFVEQCGGVTWKQDFR